MFKNSIKGITAKKYQIKEAALAKEAIKKTINKKHVYEKSVRNS